MDKYKERGLFQNDKYQTIDSSCSFYRVRERSKLGTYTFKSANFQRIDFKDLVDMIKQGPCTVKIEWHRIKKVNKRVVKTYHC